MTVLGTTYRLGSTSYVWPADILPNVRRLGPWVDDVELVLFEVEDASNLPDAEMVAELNALEVLRPRRVLMTTAAMDAFRHKAAQETQPS